MKEIQTLYRAIYTTDDNKRRSVITEFYWQVQNLQELYNDVEVDVAVAVWSPLDL